VQQFVRLTFVENFRLLLLSFLTDFTWNIASIIESEIHQSEKKRVLKSTINSFHFFELKTIIKLLKATRFDMHVSEVMYIHSVTDVDFNIQRRWIVRYDNND
jgi:phosphate starvation-inducible membrane PsiE